MKVNYERKMLDDMNVCDKTIRSGRRFKRCFEYSRTSSDMKCEGKSASRF